MNSIILYNEDCLDVLRRTADNSIDLIVTSPPYADRRKSTYGGIKSVDYVKWFKPIAAEIKRVLKVTGSFFLNIKPHTDEGERDLYVFDLVISLKRDLGFKYIDEYSWIKNAFPGDLKGRFKNGFEPVYHFSKGSSSKITFNPLVCGAAIKPGVKERADRKYTGKPDNGSGMTQMKSDNLRRLELARPSNVLQINNVVNQFSDNKSHPATYPKELCEFFIKSFSNKNDVVMDPFMGSGTTGVAAKELERSFIGVEKMEEFYNLSKKIINKTTVQPMLLGI
ncbi:MAG: site-specific DNA-methyltransferase [Cyclobacteriaceae bacterium]